MLPQGRSLVHVRSLLAATQADSGQSGEPDAAAEVRVRQR
jgi:hypothetical protein